MRRDPQLIQLSREHHAALRLAKQLLEVQSPPAAEALAAVARESAGLLSHFEQEERELLPQLLNYGEAQLAARLQDEHRQMRALLQADDAASLKLLGVLLGGHVRFEERELFETLQRHWAQQGGAAATESNAACAGSTE